MGCREELIKLQKVGVRFSPHAASSTDNDKVCAVPSADTFIFFLSATMLLSPANVDSQLHKRLREVHCKNIRISALDNTFRIRS